MAFRHAEVQAGEALAYKFQRYYRAELQNLKLCVASKLEDADGLAAGFLSSLSKGCQVSDKNLSLWCVTSYRYETGDILRDVYREQHDPEETTYVITGNLLSEKDVSDVYCIMKRAYYYGTPKNFVLLSISYLEERKQELNRKIRGGFHKWDAPEYQKITPNVELIGIFHDGAEPSPVDLHERAARVYDSRLLFDRVCAGKGWVFL